MCLFIMICDVLRRAVYSCVQFQLRQYMFRVTDKYILKLGNECKFLYNCVTTFGVGILSRYVFKGNIHFSNELLLHRLPIDQGHIYNFTHGRVYGMVMQGQFFSKFARMLLVLFYKQFTFRCRAYDS